MTTHQHALKVHTSTVKGAGAHISTGTCTCGWRTECTYQREVRAEYDKHREAVRAARAADKIAAKETHSAPKAPARRPAAVAREPQAVARMISQSAAQTVWHVDVQTGSCNGLKSYHAHTYPNSNLISLQTVTRNRIVSEIKARKIMPVIRAAITLAGTTMKYDRLTYEFKRDRDEMGVDPICVYGWSTYPDNSVLAGQPMKCFIDAFPDDAAALAAYPTAKPSNRLSEPRVNLRHLPDENTPVAGGMYPDDI